MLSSILATVPLGLYLLIQSGVVTCQKPDKPAAEQHLLVNEAKPKKHDSEKPDTIRKVTLTTKRVITRAQNNNIISADSQKTVVISNNFIDSLIRANVGNNLGFKYEIFGQNCKDSAIKMQISSFKQNNLPIDTAHRKRVVQSYLEMQRTGHSSENCKDEMKNIKIISIHESYGKDENYTPKTNNEPKLVDGVRFLEPDDETLNKLGIIKGEYDIYYYTEVPGKGSTEVSIGNNVVPVPGAKQATHEELRSKLHSLKRNFFPVFISDKEGSQFMSFNLFNPKFVDKDYLLNHANTLVPVLVKTAAPQGNYQWNDIVYWFEPTDEFFSVFSPEVGRELQAEYNHLSTPFTAKTEPSNAGQSCKYFEACRTRQGVLSGLITYPNPASVDLNVMINLYEDRRIKMNLLDVSGRLVKELSPMALTSAGRHTYTYNVEDMNEGVYLLLVESEQGEQILQRVVVHK